MGILDTIKKTASKKPVAKKPAKAEKSVEPMISQSAQANVSKDTQEAYRLLLKPLVTEKTTELAHHGKYVFKVTPAANKVTIAKAVESLYNVKVVGVNIIIQRGKAVVFGGRKGKRASTKKAIVTLVKGQKIPLFEGV